jgi:hypothetical protein
MAEIEPSTRTDQKALKRKCLARDGYHCIATGKFDVLSLRNGLYSRTAEERGGFTQCCHILPFALRNFNEENAMEVRIYSLADYLDYSRLTPAYILILKNRLERKRLYGGLFIDTSHHFREKLIPPVSIRKRML